MDAFYRDERARQFAMEWQAVNDTFYKGPAGKSVTNKQAQTTPKEKYWHKLRLRGMSMSSILDYHTITCPFLPEGMEGWG
jgi:hypothetical protein